MTSTQPVLSGLVARTRELDDDRPLLEWLAPDGHAWIRDGVGFVTSGAGLEVPAAEGTRALRAINVDDDVRLPGTGPIAVGSLPFRGTTMARLTIPARVVGIDADGTRWITEVSGIAESTGSRFAAAPVATPGDMPADLANDDNDRVRWEAGVVDVLDRIARGTISKLVLARRIVVRSEAPFDRNTVLARLMASQPGCYAYAAPGFTGASPELLVTRRGNEVTSRPMAGTAPRHLDRRDDDHAIDTLVASAKDAVEHRLVVDEVARILQSLCTDVHVSRRPDVVRLTDVAHLATTITAHAPDHGPTALDLALALHPTPAVAGCPTDAALAAIAELEGFDRGRYAGPVGWVDADGDGEWAVALRGVELRGHHAVLCAGAGIVAGSDPATEWLETEAKLATVLNVLRPAR